MDPNISQTSPVTSQSTTGSPQQNGMRGSFFQKYKRLIIGAVLLLFIFVIGVVILNLNRTKETTSSAPLLVATVGEEKIYEKEVVTAVQKQYTPDAVTPEVMNIFVNRIVEEKILDLEAEKLGIQKGNFATSEEYYNAVKAGVIGSEITSIDAFVVGYWVPPPHAYPQKPEFDVLRSDGVKALGELSAMIKAGQSPYDAAVIVQAKYSSLKSLLSVNGYRLDTTTDLSLINQPRRYQYNSENEGQLFYDALYAQKQGELKTYVWSDKSGGDIIQVTKVNEGAKMSYDEWLQQKKNELAKILKIY